MAIKSSLEVLISPILSWQLMCWTLSNKEWPVDCMGFGFYASHLWVRLCWGHLVGAWGCEVMSLVCGYYVGYQEPIGKD